MSQGPPLVTGSFVLYARLSFTESAGCCHAGAALERHHDYGVCGSAMAPLRLRCGYAVVAATAAASARMEAVLSLPCQSGENKHVCSPYSRVSLLPAS